MSKTELKPGIFIEGFDNQMSNDALDRYDFIYLSESTVLYRGKTSEIPEELAKECVLAWFFGKEFDSFEDYNNRSNGFNSAKESIRSACSQKFCIIYKTTQK